MIHDAKTIARFIAKVEQPAHGHACWFWNGERDRDGYGRMTMKRNRHRRAHQVSWEIHHGEPWPRGLVALHSCDVPPCVNPVHIRPGTQSENIRDSVAKGRWVHTKRTHCKHGHELTEENRIGVGVKGNPTGRCKTCHRASGLRTQKRKYYQDIEASRAKNREYKRKRKACRTIQ